MRDDQRFEIERAFDLLPHIIGSSWAVIWFRLNQIKNPSREEYRNKVIEYFNMADSIFHSYPDNEKFKSMKKYIMWRKQEEIKKIHQGLNKEVEKRYNRYVDYG